MTAILAEMDEAYQEARPDDLYDELSFTEYLETVTEERPKLARSSHQRLADMIEHHGTDYDDELGIRFYSMFRDDPLHDGENEFYGVETHKGIHELANQIKKGAMHGQAEKRLKLSVGPVSSGKSDVDATIREYFEEYTRTPEGAMYTFRWTNLVGDDPSNPNVDGQAYEHDEEVSRLHQDPLVLIPRSIRDRYLDQVNEALDAPYTISNDQRLDAVSEFYRDELLQKYDGSIEHVLDDHIEVIRLVADENKGNAIATFEPKDPKNQDEADITGGVNMSVLANYGEGDPRAFDFVRGALGRANRGIASGEELMRLDDAHLNTFLTVTEEQKMETQGAIARTDLDITLLGRTNMPWMREREDDEKMNAFIDRSRKIEFPYNLEYGEESKIYEKFLDNSDFDVHIEPHTLEMAGLFAVLTRIEDPSDISLVDEEDAKHSEIAGLLEKAKVYNGEEIEDKEVDITKLMDEAEDALGEHEGMSGVGVRPIIDQIEEAIQENAYRDKDYLAPNVLLEFFVENLPDYGSFDSSIADEIERDVELVEKDWYRRAEEDLRNSIAYDEEEVVDQAMKYLEHAQEYVSDGTVDDEFRGEIEPDEEFMQSVEQHLKQSRGTRDEFRQTVSNWYSKRSRRSEEVDVTGNLRLRRAVERKLWNDKKQNINFTGLLAKGSEEDLSDDQKNDWIDSLMEMGYSRPGAEDLIKEVGVKVIKENMEEDD